MDQDRPYSDAVLKRLFAFHPKVMDLSLERMRRLLGDLGNPQDKLPPVIHVAGTNGKGSTIAFMRAMLEAGGYRVHTYISPHLVRFHERIRLAGKLISEEALVATLEEVEKVNDGQSITYFEATTAAAFLAFSRTPADILLLETGLGGRLDATNVVDRPALTVLTPMALDHQDYLGEGLHNIAMEKAHILKRSTTCVCAAQEPEAEQVIAMHALEWGVPLFTEGHAWTVAVFEDGMTYNSTDLNLDLPLPALVGPHQPRNAGLAIAALEYLDGFTVDAEAVVEGLRKAVWPGRLQRLDGMAPKGWEVWIDGGHNPAAAEILVKAAKSLWPDRLPHLVLGMLEGKDLEGFLKAFKGHAQSLTAVPIPDSNKAQPVETIAAASPFVETRTASDVTEAITKIVAGARKPGVILITGSLHLVGKVLAETKLGAQN